MSKVNVMELFEKARENGTTPPEGAEERPILKVNSTEVLLGQNNRFRFSNDASGGDLPSFLSDSSTISLVPSNGGPAGRLVAAGGQYLCLARGEALWVLDMTTGLSNQRQIDTNRGAIRDMEFNANSSFLIFTDGVDVAVLKCAGINGDHVQLMGVVYMQGVGSEADPVISVHWHPTNTPSFVTLRAAAGWTLWDLVRLQTKMMSSDILGIDTPPLPSLFKGQVKEAASVSEGTFPWASASNTIAGKRVSPGVLAILRRGDPTSAASSSPPQKKGPFYSFQFSSDGSLALASIGDSLKVWSLGLKCSTVSPEKTIDEQALKNLTKGKDVKSIVGLESTKFALITTDSVIDTFVSENGALDHVRTVSVDGLELGLGARVSLGGSNPATLVIGKHSRRPVMVLIDSESVTCAELHADLASVGSLVVTPTVGNPKQFAIYMHGSVEASSSSSSSLTPSVMWTAQTLDADLLRSSADDMEERSRFSDKPDSQDSAAPDRIESTTAFGNNNTIKRASEEGVSFDLLSDTIRSSQDRVLESIRTELGRAIRAKVDEKVSMYKQQIQAENRSFIESVRKSIKENFANAMRSLMSELSAQLEARIDEKFNSLRIFHSHSNSFLPIEKRLDDLIAKVDAHIEQSNRASSTSEPPAFQQIRRLINAGDHVQAISSAAQWWKLNQPIQAGQPDLLAITCAAVVSQGKSGEPLRDISSGCYVILVLTEWAKINGAVHADRTVAVLRAIKYVISCLFVTPIQVVGEIHDLCVKSLSKSVKNAAAIIGTGDRTVDDVSRETLTQVRELMMRFSISRESTPRSSSAGGSILQLVQASGRRLQ